MPVQTDFRTIQCQAVLFTPSLQFRANKVLGHFLTEYADILDGDPVTIPAVPNLIRDVEVPQMVLKSADGSFLLQAGASRLDIVKQGNPISESESREFFKLATRMCLDYLQVHQGKAGRIACIAQRAALDPTPAMTLSRHFCQQRWFDKPLDHPGDFELHAQKRYHLGGLFDVNSWVRCKTAILTGGPPPVPGDRQNSIFVEQDINSLAEEAESRELSEGEIRQFFADCPPEMQRILDLYFPVDKR